MGHIHDGGDDDDDEEEEPLGGESLSVDLSLCTCCALSFEAAALACVAAMGRESAWQSVLFKAHPWAGEQTTITIAIAAAITNTNTNTVSTAALPGLAR